MMNVLPLTVIMLVGAAVFGILPYRISNVVTQGLCFSISSAFTAVLIGLISVNLILNSKERRSAAAPMLQLIASTAAQIHNDLFLRLGWDRFGKAHFGKLIDIYQANGRSPEAFSPEDLNALYDMVMDRKVEITDLYLKAEANARDMAAILGWAYDPEILGSILSTRAEIVSFTGLMAVSTHDIPSKRQVVKHYLDVDAALGAWVRGLGRKLGVRVTEEE